MFLHQKYLHCSASSPENGTYDETILRFLQNCLKIHPDNKGYFLETAHPVKFFDVVEPVIHEQIPIPESVKNILGKEKLSISMEPAYDDFKTFLLDK